MLHISITVFRFVFIILSLILISLSNENNNNNNNNPSSSSSSSYFFVHAQTPASLTIVNINLNSTFWASFAFSSSSSSSPFVEAAVDPTAFPALLSGDLSLTALQLDGYVPSGVSVIVKNLKNLADLTVRLIFFPASRIAVDGVQIVQPPPYDDLLGDKRVPLGGALRILPVAASAADIKSKCQDPAFVSAATTQLSSSTSPLASLSALEKSKISISVKNCEFSLGDMKRGDAMIETEKANVWRGCEVDLVSACAALAAQSPDDTTTLFVDVRDNKFTVTPTQAHLRDDRIDQFVVALFSEVDDVNYFTAERAKFSSKIFSLLVERNEIVVDASNLAAAVNDTPMEPGVAAKNTFAVRIGGVTSRATEDSGNYVFFSSISSPLLSLSSSASSSSSSSSSLPQISIANNQIKFSHPLPFNTLHGGVQLGRFGVVPGAHDAPLTDGRSSYSQNLSPQEVAKSTQVEEDLRLVIPLTISFFGNAFHCTRSTMRVSGFDLDLTFPATVKPTLAFASQFFDVVSNSEPARPAKDSWASGFRPAMSPVDDELFILGLRLRAAPPNSVDCLAVSVPRYESFTTKQNDNRTVLAKNIPHVFVSMFKFNLNVVTFNKFARFVGVLVDSVTSLATVAVSDTTFDLFARTGERLVYMKRQASNDRANTLFIRGTFTGGVEKIDPQTGVQIKNVLTPVVTKTFVHNVSVSGNTRSRADTQGYVNHVFVQGAVVAFISVINNFYFSLGRRRDHFVGAYWANLTDVVAVVDCVANQTAEDVAFVGSFDSEQTMGGNWMGLLHVYNNLILNQPYWYREVSSRAYIISGRYNLWHTMVVRRNVARTIDFNSSDFVSFARVLYVYVLDNDAYADVIEDVAFVSYAVKEVNGPRSDSRVLSLVNNTLRGITKQSGLLLLINSKEGKAAKFNPVMVQSALRVFMSRCDSFVRLRSQGYSGAQDDAGVDAKIVSPMSITVTGLVSFTFGPANRLVGERLFFAMATHIGNMEVSRTESADFFPYFIASSSSSSPITAALKKLLLSSFSSSIVGYFSPSSSFSYPASPSCGRFLQQGNTAGEFGGDATNNEIFDNVRLNSRSVEELYNAPLPRGSALEMLQGLYGAPTLGGTNGSCRYSETRSMSTLRTASRAATETLGETVTLPPTRTRSPSGTERVLEMPELVPAGLEAATGATVAVSGVAALAVGPVVALDAGRALALLGIVGRCRQYEEAAYKLSSTAANAAAVIDGQEGLTDRQRESAKRSIGIETAKAATKLKELYAFMFLTRELRFPESLLPVCWGKERGQCLRGGIVGGFLFIFLALLGSIAFGVVSVYKENYGKWKCQKEAMIDRGEGEADRSNNNSNNNNNNNDDNNSRSGRRNRNRSRNNSNQNRVSLTRPAFGQLVSFSVAVTRSKMPYIFITALCVIASTWLSHASAFIVADRIAAIERVFFGLIPLFGVWGLSTVIFILYLQHSHLSRAHFFRDSQQHRFLKNLCFCFVDSEFFSQRMAREAAFQIEPIFLWFPRVRAAEQQDLASPSGSSSACGYCLARLVESFFSSSSSSSTSNSSSTSLFSVSSWGKFFFSGDYVWSQGSTRRSITNGVPGTVLQNFGSILSKYHGPFTFDATDALERKRRLLENSMNSSSQAASLPNNNNNNNNNNNTTFSLRGIMSNNNNSNNDNENENDAAGAEDEEEKIAWKQPLRNLFSPFAVFINASFCVAAALAHAVAALHPNRCQDIMITMALVNLAAFVIESLLRPFLAPGRNLLASTSDLLVFIACAVSIPALAARDPGETQRLAVASTVFLWASISVHMAGALVLGIGQAMRLLKFVQFCTKSQFDALRREFERNEEEMSSLVSMEGRRAAFVERRREEHNNNNSSNRNNLSLLLRPSAAAAVSSPPPPRLGRHATATMNHSFPPSSSSSRGAAAAATTAARERRAASLILNRQQQQQQGRSQNNSRRQLELDRRFMEL